METRKKRKPEILLRKVLSYVMTVVLIAGMIPMEAFAGPSIREILIL
ncbi:MAG: hypothetical protein K5686_10930 [Lachnospiraceae bacterium]|nr:hypothetical protein [Lachnospiraceae bacterium]